MQVEPNRELSSFENKVTPMMAQLDIQTTEWQKQSKILGKIKKSRADPARLLQMNNQVQQAASNVIDSQKELIAQQNAEIQSLRARIQELGVNPIPPQINPRYMNDEGKVPESDVPLLGVVRDDEQMRVAEWIESSMYRPGETNMDSGDVIEILKTHSISGQNMDIILTIFENKLSKLSQELKGTFYIIECDGLKSYNCLDRNGENYINEHPRYEFIRIDSNNLGVILADLIKQKNNMNVEQKNKLFTIIKTFQDQSLSRYKLKEEGDSIGFEEVDEALELAGEMMSETVITLMKVELFGDEAKPD